MVVFRPLLFCTALAVGAVPALAQPGHVARPRVPVASGMTERIVAVVNGDAITSGDVDARGKLFALSTGLPVTPEVLARLRPQVLKQLIDERLRLQEVQRRKIVVGDQEIADAIADIEKRNGMAKGALGASLRGHGVAMRTLIDQVRVQLGWTKVLREELGSKARITDAEIAEQLRLFKEQIGKPEFHLGEIFIPIDEPSKAADAEKFAETVIEQLRKGAPFPVVAAQFSQSQTALQGGDLGWVRDNQMDPGVAAVVAQMPAGAVSNPVRVPGGISIVTLAGKRVIGQGQSTVLSIRQVFLPFSVPLKPGVPPTDQQRRAVAQAAVIGKSVKNCSDMEAANDKAGKTRPSDPGEIKLEGVGSLPLRQLLGSLPVGEPSRPLVATEGVAVVMVCTRQTQTQGLPSKQEITNQVLSQRIELTARQLQRDLRRRAVLDLRVDDAQR